MVIKGEERGGEGCHVLVHGKFAVFRCFDRIVFKETAEEIF